MKFSMKKWPYKTGDPWKEVEFIWSFLWKSDLIRQMTPEKRFKLYDRTRNMWSFNTGDCLIKMTTYKGTLVYIAAMNSSLLIFPSSSVSHLHIILCMSSSVKPWPWHKCESSSQESLPLQSASHFVNSSANACLQLTIENKYKVNVSRIAWQ